MGVSSCDKGANAICKPFAIWKGVFQKRQRASSEVFVSPCWKDKIEYQGKEKHLDHYRRVRSHKNHR